MSLGLLDYGTLTSSFNRQQQALCDSLSPWLTACPSLLLELTGEAAVVRLAAALGAGPRVISLDLLLLAGHDLRFGPPPWVRRD